MAITVWKQVWLLTINGKRGVPIPEFQAFCNMLIEKTEVERKLSKE
jgi:hypothetical protein